MSNLAFGGQDIKIVVEGYGDMTDEVAIELAKLRKAEHERDVAMAARRQAHIAKVCGTEAPLMQHGQLVAQIDGAVFADWERREGRGFFGDKSNRRWFLKKFPECRVRGIPKNARIVVPDKSNIVVLEVKGAPKLGQRGGRWAS